MKTLLIASVLTLAALSPAARAQTYDDYTARDALDMEFNVSIDGFPACSHRIDPTISKVTVYSKDRREVQVSGDLSFKGETVPLNDFSVEVIPEMDNGFVALKHATTDVHGHYSLTFQAPAPIRSISVRSRSMVCVDAEKH